MRHEDQPHADLGAVLVHKACMHPHPLASAIVGAIMGDACDRLPVVMLINAATQSFCLSLSRADHDMKGLG